jgi:hypothetical protein
VSRRRRLAVAARHESNDEGRSLWALTPPRAPGTVAAARRHYGAVACLRRCFRAPSSAFRPPLTRHRSAAPRVLIASNQNDTTMRRIAGPLLGLALTLANASANAQAGATPATPDNRLNATRSTAIELDEPSAQPPTVDNICRSLEQSAAENALPVEFFARVIWQESRFDARAISPKGAKGIAQFMPATASWHGRGASAFGRVLARTAKPVWQSWTRRSGVQCGSSAGQRLANKPPTLVTICSPASELASAGNPFDFHLDHSLDHAGQVFVQP